MKLTRKKPTKTAKVVAKPKRSFDGRAFVNSLNSLDKDNYGSAPLPVRWFVMLLIALLLAALAWFLLLKPKLEEIRAAEANSESLLTTYTERESKARHLDEYKDQVAQMEVEFNELLNQLPKDTRVPELIEGINMVGSGSGIRFQDISVPEAVEQEFFIEQPIDITALGGYHKFGDFLTGLSALPRIITMHDFELSRVGNEEVMTDSPQLQLVLHTKTYRSKEEQPAETDTPETATEGDNQ